MTKELKDAIKAALTFIDMYRRGQHVSPHAADLVYSKLKTATESDANG